MVRYKRTGHVSEVEEVVAAYRGLKLYLDTPVPGLWWDRLNADGTFVEEAAPASSFYHIVCALNELLA
jgi:mannose-6-phosphate isomerase